MTTGQTAISNGLNENSMKPFGGIIPDTVLGRTLAEIIADPYDTYSPKKISELIDKSPSSVGAALKILEDLLLIKNISSDRQHPQYKIINESKKFIALSFLSLAWVDDIEKSNCMDIAIKDYSIRHLGLLELSCIGQYAICRGSNEQVMIVTQNTLQEGNKFFQYRGETV